MSKINKIGIMSGRLSEPLTKKIQEFPRNTWKYEFEKASVSGFRTIEWIFDAWNKNPVMNNDGINQIKHFSEQTDITINSLLADYFMEKKLFSVSEFDLQKNLEVLRNLIKNSNKLGIKILEIPFVDSSSLKTKEEQSQVLSNIEKIVPLLEEYDVFLTLETDLSPISFKELIISFNHPNIKANYDVGNSTSLGYDMKEELNLYGDLIYNIHIKDRKYRGQTVPLGNGDTDFELFFNLLQKINYDGELIIQGARECGINPEETCTKYLQFVKKFVDKY
uniref:Xylose isomerase-like TIM barrel domain-containing protein (SgbU) n=1 Tax=uncultured marine thaumarchaeote KM3_35_D03 TaxID=1456132 RepID=A0A075GZ31_9ARCH|nr:xylose isomerase-like TIM barrel domain-containing protein (sgbU) [uncultured marine thaumarchaeote KM3_35_D03]